MSQPMFAVCGDLSRDGIVDRFAVFEQYSGQQVSDFASATIQNTGEFFTPFFDITTPLRSMSFSPDGRRIVFAAESFGSSVGQYSICRIEANGSVTRLPEINPYLSVGSAIYKVRFSPDGTRIAFACQGGAANKRLVVVNSETAAEVASSTRATGGMFDLAFLPSGAGLIAVGYGSNKISIFNSAWGLSTSPADPPFGIDNVAVSPDGSMFVVGTSDHLTDHVATIYTTNSPSIVHQIELPQGGDYMWPNCFSFSPDGTKLAMSIADGGSVAIRVFNTDNWSVAHDVSRAYTDSSNSTWDGFWPHSISFTADSSKLVVALGGPGVLIGGTRSKVFIIDPALPTFQSPGNIPVFLRSTPGTADNTFLNINDLVMLPSNLLSKRLVGTVTDNAGLPAERTVRVYNRTSGRLMAQQTSGVDGSFSFAFMHSPEIQRVVLDSAGTPVRNDITDRIIPA